METKSIKTEILKDLKELKEKGVIIIMHDEFLVPELNNNSFLVMGNISGSNCNGNCSCKGKSKPETIKKPSDFSIDIYQNSTEEQIKKLISDVKNILIFSEERSKSTAIVDFLKEELK